MATRELQRVFRSARDAGPHLVTFLLLSLRTKALEAKIYSKGVPPKHQKGVASRMSASTFDADWGR